MSFYTYAHYTKDTKQLFYIGKGRGKRAWQHFGRNNHWKHKVAKHGVSVEILAKWSTEQKAFEHEKFLISCFKGSLVNLTDGGEGTSGFVPKEEQREKVRKALTGVPLTDKRKKNISDSLKNRNLSEEHASKSRATLAKNRELSKKKVFCKTSNTLYLSVTEAATAEKVDTSSIVKACKGILKTAGKKEWCYGRT